GGAVPGGGNGPGLRRGHAHAAPSAVAVPGPAGADRRLYAGDHGPAAGALAASLRAGAQEHPGHRDDHRVARNGAGPPMEYLIAKWLHILTSAVLFGTGIGTAFYLFAISLGRDTRQVATISRYVVIGDWLF